MPNKLAVTPVLVLLLCANVVFLTLGNKKSPWRSTAANAVTSSKSKCLTVNDSGSTFDAATTAAHETRQQAVVNHNETLSAVANQVFFSQLHYNRYESIADMKAAKVPLVNPHVHVKDRFWICAAPKTGCTAWMYFLLYINDGIVIPKTVSASNPGLVHSRYASHRLGWTVKHSTRTEADIVQRFSDFPHFVVARNPYVRFVSSWKDWMHRTKRPGVSLEKFAKLYQARQEIPEIYHVHPVSKICGVNNPLHYTVLRVEEQALWFDALLSKFNLTQELQNYTQQGGNTLFSSHIHNTSLLTNHLEHVLGQQPWPGTTFASKHHRGSARTVTDYYTPEIAALVTELFHKDFVNFQYPLWDGNPETFRFV